jgi:hypothetical protein
MTDPTHGPIEKDQRAMMRGIAEALDEAFNRDERPKKIAFVLLTAHFGDYEGGRVNYIANGDRADIISMMKELIARFEGRYSQDDGRA